MIRHERTHNKDRQKIKCQKCEKSYISHEGLVSHVKYHHDKGPDNEDNFQCIYCSKTFKYEFYLNRHQVVHTGEKNFQCTECGKSFGHKATMLRHVKAHSGNQL